MDKTLKIYSAVLVLLILAIVVIDSKRPKPIDWTPSFSLNDKIPFGMYVFDQEIKAVLKDQKISKFNTTAYEFLDNHYASDTIKNKFTTKGTYLSISKIAELDPQSISTVCKFVNQGNSAFISSEIIPNALLDSLNLKMDGEPKYVTSMYNWLANENLGTKKYLITEGRNDNYFSKIDTVNTTVLGYQTGDSTRVNFIKVNYKKGFFYLHTQPAAFTNFHLLKRNHYQYAEKILSYIPKGNVFWHTQNQTTTIISNSPMRYILSQPALKWAWYIFLLGMLVFIFFNAKRKQRVVPILKPLANTTVDFIKTISNLYYQEGNHNNIIDKKIVYFLEKIRTDFLIETFKLDDDFVKKLHLKSGKDINDIKNVVTIINSYRKNNYLSIEDDLLELNNAIEKVVN